jgi:hypothetical protein
MPLSMKVSMRLDPRAKLESQKATHTELGPPRTSAEYRLKVFSDIDRRRLHHSILPKHRQADLNNRAKAETHSRNLAMQSIPLNYCKLMIQDSFNFAERIPKLAILVSVAHFESNRSAFSLGSHREAPTV